MSNVLEVQNLRTEFRMRHSSVVAVDDISFSVGQGECVGIVGESGCGKSTTGLSVMRLLPNNGHVIGGSITLLGRDLATLDEKEMRQVRGDEVALIPQDPLTALNPTMTIGKQISEGVRLHRAVTKAQARQRALEVLTLVEMPRPAERLDQYPHELSGGLRQRVMIAMALACEPKLLIADEPTTALDVTIQAQILDLIDDLRERLHMGVILITHDMGVIAGRTDRVDRDVRREDRGGSDDARALRERAASLCGSPSGLGTENRPGPWRVAPDHSRASRPTFPRRSPNCRFCAPLPLRHRGVPGGGATAGIGTRRRRLPSFRMLPPGRASAGARGRGREAANGVHRPRHRGARSPHSKGHRAILSVTNLVKEFPVLAGGVIRHQVGAVHAVSDVTLSIREGETFGLVGESGCGKTTIGRMMVALEEPTAGSVHFEDHVLTDLKGSALRAKRRDVQLMFQDPYASLDPRMRVGTIIGEPLRVQKVGTHDEQRDRVASLLREVGLSPQSVQRYPHEFSGGQRQRIGLARALALEPKLVVADEPVSALDVSIQAQILNLMKDLQRRHGLTYVLISHDLAVVRYMADTIGVMYLGKLVELGPSADVYSHPAHPYTQGLLDAVPTAEYASSREERKLVVRGELPSAVSPPSGCRFRTRCPRAQVLCAEVEPLLVDFGTAHTAACHFPLQTPVNIRDATPALPTTP